MKTIRLYFRSKINQLKYRNYLPDKQKSSDIFIVEFPKSGITWLSTIIANINLIQGKSSLKATYYNIQQLIPDIHMSRNVTEHPVWENYDIRFIKSHSSYCPFYNHVIYLVRNPLSVMNSYFHYLKMLDKFRGNFRSFIRDKRYGIDAWINHVESWLFRGDSSQRLHLVKYEDLVNRPIDTIERIYKNLGVLISIETVKKAIKLSEFERMKASEEYYKKFNPNTSLKFMREGSNVVSDIDEDVRDVILEKTKTIRSELGY